MSEDEARGAAQAAEMAIEAGLIYVSDDMPGISRVRDANGFSYVGHNGAPITANAELERIARLAIPPAYEEVWICRDRRGHLQATGRDARRRKQYRYHADWRRRRDDAKFMRMIEFGEALPRLRQRLRRDLAQKGLPRDKVLAVVVSLLDATRVRIGNVEYAKTNDSYGLTTLRNRHVKFVRDGRVVLCFRGKGGADHEVPVDDKALARLVRRCHELPGQTLFQYLDEEGGRRPVDSEQVNEYLKSTMGAPFTAKDFRTWGATLRAIALMAETPMPESTSESAIKACINAAIKEVARELRNTPAVCRKSYINPVVFDAWRDGTLQKRIKEDFNSAPRRAERSALAFLRRVSRTGTPCALIKRNAAEPAVASKSRDGAGVSSIPTRARLGDSSKLSKTQKTKARAS
jgi:DNA topoisomerase I